MEDMHQALLEWNLTMIVDASILQYLVLADLFTRPSCTSRQFEPHMVSLYGTVQYVMNPHSLDSGDSRCLFFLPCRACPALPGHTVL